MGSPEDERAAATLKVTLACGIIAASFASIAVEAAVAVFVFDKRQGLIWFDVLAGLATCALVASAACGSKGAAAVYKAGYRGVWNVAEGKAAFSGQAALGFLGVILIVASALSGKTKPENNKEPHDYAGLKMSVDTLQTTTSGLRRDLGLQATEILNLREKLTLVERKKHRRCAPCNMLK